MCHPTNLTEHPPNMGYLSLIRSQHNDLVPSLGGFGSGLLTPYISRKGTQSWLLVLLQASISWTPSLGWGLTSRKKARSALCIIQKPRADPRAPRWSVGCQLSWGPRDIRPACPPVFSCPLSPVMLEPVGIAWELPYARSHARCWLNPLI